MITKLTKGFHRRRIFTNSLSDWLDDEVPIEWLDEMLDTIRQCSDVTWILCTKRPENFYKRLLEVEKNVRSQLAHWVCSWMGCLEIPENIILLASVENQEMADKRVPELLKIPAACRGLSLEPLLGPIDLRRLIGFKKRDGAQLDWLIIGGESGPKARACNLDWIRSLVAQGKAAGVPTFVKQLGANVVDTWKLPPDHPANGQQFEIGLCDKKGADPAEWPEDLHVQEWPKL